MRLLARSGERQVAARAFGVRVMLLSNEPEGASARRLAQFGSQVDCEADFFTALGNIIDDPMGYDLFVMECDSYGGIEAGERAVAMLIAGEARMRVMLISGDFDVPAYPLGRRTAVCLPFPATDECLRLGFDHALRDRQAMLFS